jgi:hypothetical protein
MISVPDIATAAIAAITPLLPYLSKLGDIAGKGFAEALAKSGAEAVWNTGGEVWNKLVGASQDDAKLDGALKLLTADPSDENSVVMAEKVLKNYIERNPAFGDDLLAKLGDANRVQEMLAERNSRLSGNAQRMDGSGEQSMVARDGSVIENSIQSMGS